MSSGLEFSTKGLQTVCPTGISSFDNLIGGGFALTSINIIEEDQFQTYSSMLSKAYLSSAIFSDQDIIIFSPNVSSKKSRFIRELPSFQIIKDDPLEGNISPAKECMKIAFRYSNLPSRFDQSEIKKIDFGNYIDSMTIEQANIEFYDHSNIIEILREKIKKSDSNQVCRILIEQLGSPLSCFNVQELPKIVHQIKMCMRRLTKSVCLINLISSSNKDYDLLESLANLIRTRLYFEADSVIKCIAFEERENNPYSQDYVGLLQLLHLPRLNSLGPYNPLLETTEYGIKIHQSKRYLSVEKLALPPDLGEAVNRFTSSTQAADAILCSLNTNLIDY